MIYLEQANGYFPYDEILVPYSFKDKVISQYKYNYTEKDMEKKNILYLFIQKADSGWRKLSDGSRCSISKNVATPNIDGTVEREE